MKPRGDGEPLEVPERFRQENAPEDGDEHSQWNRERAAWFRARGISYLSVLQEDYRQARALRQAR